MEMIGIDVIWETVLEHRKRYIATGELEANREKQAVDWMWALVNEGLKERFYQNSDVKKILPRILKEVENGTTASTIAASKLLFLLDNNQQV